MLRDAGADFFAADPEGRRLRDWRGRSPGYDIARWREMARLGWPGLCIPESYGGTGCSLAQAVHLLEQCGRALAPEPLVGGALLPASSTYLSAPASTISRSIRMCTAGCCKCCTSSPAVPPVRSSWTTGVGNWRRRAS